MRKRIIAAPERAPAAQAPQWLDLEVLAEVEVSSEAPGHPIEAALLPGHDAGWEAAEPGEQVIRILFDTPRRLSRLRLHFVETSTPRLQEFVLSWSSRGAAPWQEIVRQQYHFSPPGTFEEVEEYHVQLPSVKALQLIIQPAINSGPTRASLARWQVS